MLTKTRQSNIKPLRWQRTQYSAMSRQIDVLQATISFMTMIWWDNLWGNYTAEVKRQRAKWLVRNMLELGPTFIKIGQSLSTRSDLLPKEYIEELGTLQDQVPAFATEEAIAIIASELGKPVDILFKNFDPVPLAAASLGQVHRATLYSGEAVVIKVQRPGLKKLFDLDIKVLKKIIHFCQKRFAWAKTYDLEAIYYEFFHILFQEIDYIQEGENADRFRQNFKDLPEVIVPKVYWQYCTQKVLVLEYLPGIKINQREAIVARNISPQRLNQIGVCCYLKQLLLDGFFQADPHPGNLAVSDDGGIIFYDFGMMSEVKGLTRDQMVKTFFAVLRKDTDQVIETLTSMGLIVPAPDMMPVRRLISFLLERFTEKPIDFYEFNEVKDELYTMFEQQPFRLPAQMTFILKSLTTLDGVARVLDPDYSLITCSQPFVKSLTISQQKGGIFGEVARQTRDFIKYRLQQPSKAELIINNLEKRVADGEIQLRVRTVESDRLLKRLNLAVKSLVYCCFSGFSILAGCILLVSGVNYFMGAIACFSVGSLTGILLLQTLFQLSVKERLDRMAEK